MLIKPSFDETGTVRYERHYGCPNGTRGHVSSSRDYRTYTVMGFVWCESCGERVWIDSILKSTFTTTMIILEEPV